MSAESAISVLLQNNAQAWTLPSSTSTPSHLRLRLAVTAALLALLVLAGAAAWRIHSMRSDAWQRARTQATERVVLAQQGLSRRLAQYDAELRGAVQTLAAPGLAGLDRRAQHVLLFGYDAGLGPLALLDAAGQVVASSSPLPQALSGSLAASEAFTVQHDRAATGLLAAAPLPDGTLPLSRRVETAEGAFAGAALALVPPAELSALLTPLPLGEGQQIRLTRADGVLLASVPRASDAAAPPLAGMQAGLPSPFVARCGRASCLVAFAAMDGLFVSASVPVDLAWHASAWVAAAAACVLAAACGLLLHGERRRHLRAMRDAARATSVFETFFSGSLDALFLLRETSDGQLRYQAVNPAFEHLSGLAAGAICGQAPADLFEPETAAGIERCHRMCHAGAPTQSYTMPPLAPGARPAEVTLAAVHDRDGNVRVIIGSVRSPGEAALEMARMEAVGRLTASVAHDFNNTLQIVIGSLETLLAEHLAEAEPRLIAQAAQTAAAGGAAITHSLLAFTRQQVLQPRRVNVGALIADTRGLLGTAGLGARISVKVAVEPFTADILVDPAHAQTCLLNLMLNAAEAMPDGGSLVLHAHNATPKDGRCGELAPGGRHVILAVHDSGRGMDEATRARAFEPFFTTKRAGRGAGLGLSMAQGFCRQSGGDIRLLSGGAVGTRVELWLPAAASMMGGDERQFNLATIGRGTGRILLVEDEERVAAVLSDMLVGGGFEVVAVSSAADGLLRLGDRDPYDAVLTDYAMPEATGAEFLQRAALLVPGLPMLMITGFEVGEVVVEGRPVRQLRKPAHRSALLNAVREEVGAGGLRSMPA